jgi:hypothetical protein
VAVWGPEDLVKDRWPHLGVGTSALGDLKYRDFGLAIRDIPKLTVDYRGRSFGSRATGNSVTNLAI